MSDWVKSIVYEYTKGLKKIYGTCIRRIVLYGSYARGDNNQSSDIDIMILVNLTEEEIKETMTAVADYTFEMEMQYNVIFSPIIKNEKQFSYWADTLPFYKNIISEGMVLSEQ